MELIKETRATTKEVFLWAPHENQSKILDDKKRFKVVVCGRQFGKTTMAVNLLLEEALVTNSGLFFYVAPYYTQAKMIAWQKLMDAVQTLPRELVKKVNESELYVVVGNNSKICIKGADKPDTLRGVTLDGVVLDEYADMKSDVFSKIIMPTLTIRKGWCLFIGTPRGFNHFHALYVWAKGQEDWSTYRFTTLDSPYASAEEVERARATLPEDDFQQEYMADFRRMTGLVYKEFERETHVVEKRPERQFIEVIAGVDFGYTNPTAIVVIGKDFDNHYWVIDEWYEKQKTMDEIIEVAKNLQSRYNINIFYPDPAEPDRIKEMQRSGLTVRNVNKDIAAGIGRVQGLLKTKRLHILGSCTNLLWEMERYRFPPTKGDLNQKEEPVKENDHLLDALRYCLYTNEPTDIRNQGEEFKLYTEGYE